MGEIGGGVGIQLFQDTSHLLNLTQSVTVDAGSFLWPLAKAPAGPATNYRIRIFAVADPSIEKFSDYFTLSHSPKSNYAFLSPIAEDTVYSGGSLRLQWTVPENKVSLSQISLWRDQPRDSLMGYTPSSPEGNGFEWRVPENLAPGQYRIRIASYPDPRLYTFSPVIHVLVIASDAYEYDNVLAEAKTIPSLGNSESHTLTPGDVDWIRFRVDSRKFYRFQVSADRELAIELCDSLGLKNFEKEIRQINFTWHHLAVGPNYLRLINPSKSLGAHYQVAIFEYDSATLQPSTFTAPQSNTVWRAGTETKITWNPDTALFTKQITLSLLHDSSLVSTVAIYQDNSGEITWEIPDSLPTSNRYRLQMGSMSSGLIRAYGPLFTIEGLSPDAFEPDDSIQGAKEIFPDQATQSRNFLAGEMDWCRFHAIAGKDYQAELITTSIFLAMAITDSAGVEYDADTTRSPVVAFTAPKEGSYFLKIRGLMGAGPYTLRISSPP